MRHPLGWTDLSARRVGIFGVGVEGVSARRRLEGISNDIVFVDDSPAASVEGHEVVATSEGGIDLLFGCDVVIKSPGISRYRADVQALESAGIPVVGGTGLSLHEMDRERVICITGTKGKSTTSSVLGHLLNGLGKRTAVTGNIGLPLFDPAVPKDLDLYVVEVSSFQALDVADAPGIVIVTSLAVDHVDWHGSAKQYQADKLSLTSLEGARITIAQEQSEGLRQNAELLGGDVRWGGAPKGSWTSSLGLLGEHNLANAELARMAIDTLDLEGAIGDEALFEAGQGFAPLPGRLSDVGSLDGVRFVDDSLATNVLPTLAALDSFEGQRLAIMIGGFDRGVSYDALVEALARRTGETLVVGLPDTGAHLVEQILERTRTTQGAIAGSVEAATALAFEWAVPDGVVLMSPAAPSFSQFANWKERSEAFRQAIERL
jgi:UDP-N-acetylmuramoylalanine--D-glutamate ligase